jgi:hypothetical protein
VDLEWTRQQFDRCWPWLEKAVQSYGNTYTKEHVWAEIEAKRAFLWPMKNAAMVSLIRDYPTGLREGFGWLAGGDLEEIKYWMPMIERCARDLGCHRLTILGRRGWVKALDGFRELATEVTKEL